MPGLGELFGTNGMLEQLVLWQTAGQLVQAVGAPYFTEVQNLVQAAHPEVVLTPELLARAVAQQLVAEDYGHTEAAKSGIDAGRFDTLLELAKVRLQPADLAEAVLRSYLTTGQANDLAAPQGYTPEMMGILADLAGDAPGADELAEALRRGLIPANGRGADSISFEQGIAETRLHNKWGPVIEGLAAVLLSPADIANAWARGYLDDDAALQAAAEDGVKPATFAILQQLAKVRLSPPDAAEAVIRNFLPADAGAAVAASQGVPADMFATMTHLAGDAPGPQQLAEALRRGAIPLDGTGPDSTSFTQGIAEGRLADKWAPVIEALSKLWPTPDDALEARVKGQITPEQGKELYQLLGGDMQFYQWLLDSRGNAPTPLEAIEMANRGIIKWDGRGPQETTYQQAFYEGMWRDKWEKPYRALATYLPPESTIVTLLSHGVLDTNTGAELLAKWGMDADTITAYLAEAHTEALSDYRGLTVSTVLDAYYEQTLAPADATNILEALHVTPGAVAVLLAYVDMRRSFAQVNSAITRVRSLFAARKITADTAKQSLVTLDVPAAQIESIIATWEVENSITVKLLTEAQIADAVKYEIMDVPTALTELENIGYTPYDAWVLLSINQKAKLDNQPAVGPAAPQGQVIPGTT